MAAAPHGCADRHAHPKTHHGRPGRIPRRVVGHRRVVGIGPTAVHRHRVVGGHVHPLGIGRLNHDRIRSGTPIRRLRGHGLLAVGIERSGGLGPLPQTLDGGHRAFGIGQIGVAQTLHPIELRTHHLQNGREGQEAFDRGIPVLGLEGIGQRSTT